MSENAAGTDVPVATKTPSYQLERPTLATARAALRSFYGPHTDDVWRTLIFSAGLSGDETDPASLRRLLAAMQGAAPLIQLCGRGLAIRLAAHERLASPQH
ncbi:hypothetical protein OHA21_15365 [Actinoplanes sp. NBC_00393]|uniref:hypothetical protein n=1 Tax=Actinoplanes sp. NBC_00393 TaxID=2975953 RepID=UPI002E1E4B10